MKKYLVPIILVLPLALTACGEEHDGVSETTAKSNCKTLVSEQLTNPDDADWQNSYDVQAWEIDGGYRIHGEVAVANAFGGKVAHIYECKVTANEDSENPSIVVEAIEPK